MDRAAYRSYCLNADRIQTALNKWKADKLPGDLCRFMDTDNADLKLILDAFGIVLSLNLYRRADLKSIKTKLEIIK